MKIKTSIFMIIVLLAACFSYAQPFNRDDRRMFDCDNNCMRIPDLTEDQMAKIQKLKLDHQKEVLPIQTKIKTQQLELKTMILENTSQKQILNKVEDIGKIKIELMKKHMVHRLAVRNLLTDTQKIYFDSKGFDRHGPYSKANRKGRPGRYQR